MPRITQLRGNFMHSFEIYKDKKGEFRFRFRAGNGEPMFASEAYKSKASAMKSIESVRKNAAGAGLTDLSVAAKAAPAKAAKAPAKAAKTSTKATKAPAATARAPLTAATASHKRMTAA